MEKFGSNSFIIVAMGASLEGCVDITPELTYFNMRIHLSTAHAIKEISTPADLKGTTWSGSNEFFFSAVWGHRLQKTTTTTTIA